MDDATTGHAFVRVTHTRGHRYAYISMGGDIDVSAEPALAAAVAQLEAVRCASLCVDLAGIRFAGTTLLTFLVRVINRVPDDTPVLLCRPGRMIRRLIELSSLDTLAILRDDLPYG